MWIAFIDTALTFVSHAVAATHLAPLKYGREKTYLIWGAWTALAPISSCFVSAPQSGSAAYSASAFLAACLFHVELYFLTTRGGIGERFFLILSYAAFFTACCAVTQYIEAFMLPQIDWLYLLVYGDLWGHFHVHPQHRRGGARQADGTEAEAAHHTGAGADADFHLDRSMALETSICRFPAVQSK